MFARAGSLQVTALSIPVLIMLIPASGSRADQSTAPFATVSPNSLVRALHQTDADSSATLPAGLLVRRQHRWLAEPGCMVVETSLVNQGTQPRRLGDIVVAEWAVNDAQALDAARYPLLSYRDDVWYGSTYWTGPDWTRVGKDWHHSGTHTSSIRRFTAPRAGRVEISGRIFKADTNGGDGVRLQIRLGRQTVWQAEIDADDAVGVEPKLTLEVRKGDAIRFVVHRRGEIGFDTTHWDPVITFDKGEVFRASSGFSTRQQGEHGWQYEMEYDSDAEDVNRGTVVHSFGSDFFPRHQPVTPAGLVTLESATSLPAWIVTDVEDKSGVVLAGSSRTSWQFQCEKSGEGELRMRLVTRFGDSPAPSLQPGGSLRLPDVVLAAYDGTWLQGTQTLQRMLTSATLSSSLSPLREAVVRAAKDLGVNAPPHSTPEVDLCAMVQLEWQRQDELSDNAESYRQAAERHISSARVLLADLRLMRSDDYLAEQQTRLDELANRVHSAQLELAGLRKCYLQTRWLKREIALSNPLLDFGRLLFCKRVPTSYSHLVMQYYGWRARPGGGIFELERPGYSLACRDILDGRLTGGNVLEPRLDYDGTRIVFSFVACRPDGATWDPASIDNSSDEGFYHLWTCNADGTGLTQRTDGPFDDLMPCWLPDGGIAFSSTRRRGYARCFGGQFSRRWHVYTLHRMNSDGTGLRLLSAHDTNEWFPTISNSGHILYSRWDYIDRDAVTHQNLWAMRPDGTNPIAVWGNATSSPHCSFQAQAIPHSAKIVFTASAHHSITGGSLAILDPSIGNDGHEAITRLTPEIPFPEAESSDIREYYAAPWPLSEKYFLVAYSPTPLVWEPGANRPDALGIYLLDAFGNRELIYRDPQIGCTNPTPLTVRPRPPVISSMLPDHAPPTGEMVLTDVYQGLGEVERGTIRQLRIIQIFPKTTPVADAPRVGLAREENARAILGTVPVEADGSARFLVPAMKPLLFQALDQDGCAFQTMRTVTYVQPGERVSCVGCHENRMTAPPVTRPTLALLRPPSVVEPGSLGGRPFSYVEVVQPVWDRHCVRCHGRDRQDAELDLSGSPRDGFSQSYWALCNGSDFWGAGTNPSTAAAAWVPRFGGRNQVQITPPGGLYGARGSRLIKLLRTGHYDVQLTAEELSRVAAWIDCNAVFYGVYDPADQARQLSGESLAMPAIQ